MTMKLIYLAGPDVFYKDATARGVFLKHLCEKFGCAGLWPFDNDAVGDANAATAIFEANRRMIQKCDAVVANIEPFRGPHCDPGTAWEIGYAHALGKPVIVYSGQPTLLSSRISEKDAFAVEPFGLIDNLMVLCAAKAVFSTAFKAVEAAARMLGASQTRETAPGRQTSPSNSRVE